MMKSGRCLLWLLCLWLTTSCNVLPERPNWCSDEGLCSGNLLFVRAVDTVGMEAAIAASTGTYTHVAVLEYADSQYYVIEATPRLGVVRRPLDQFFEEIWLQDSSVSPLTYVDFYYLVEETDIPALMERLHSHLGEPYDDAFLPDNGRMYCSELVYECVKDREGRPVFEANPMNFKGADGRIHPYWQAHFDSLGVAVPQGVPGTNPTDMSRSERLHRFKIE